MTTIKRYYTETENIDPDFRYDEVESENGVFSFYSDVEPIIQRSREVELENRGLMLENMALRSRVADLGTRNKQLLHEAKESQAHIDVLRKRLNGV